VRSKALVMVALLGTVGILTPSPQASRAVGSAVPARRTLAGQTPVIVLDGAATLRSHHDPAASLTLNIGLAVRDSAALDGLIAAASDPASPQYGHYLTPAQYIERFAPADTEVQAVRAWAGGAGLRVDAVSPDHLLMTVRGTSASAERALGVHINDYSLGGRRFQSNDRDATVPAGLDIRSVSGLSTLYRVHAMSQRTWSTRTASVRSGGYYPDDFKAAYNVGPVGDGKGQTIGLTLWGSPLPQSDLDTFAAHTGTTRVISGGAGDDGIDWTPVNNNPYTNTSVLNEVALDVEYAHGMAPHSHLKYWLSDCTVVYDPAHGPVCSPSTVGLEQAVSAAAHAHDTDPTLHAVSNSWGGNEPATADDYAFASNLDASFQYAASQGVTFYFSSGDTGYASGSETQCDPAQDPAGCTQALPSYPADSPYVVAVGGTSLQTGVNYSYGSESAWNGSGGGCSLVEGHPSWQTGVGAATCAGRAEPDVSADAYPNTGAYVAVYGGGYRIGGTSLAAPLWAGMMTSLNRSLADTGRPAVGFAAPRLYALANSTTTYGRDFHDVTNGNNDPSPNGTDGAYAQSAGPGWDEATGWGSPNLANLAADWAVSGATPTATLGPSATSPASPSATPIPGLTSAPTSATPGSAATPSATPASVTCGLPCQDTVTPTAAATPPAPTQAPASTPTSVPVPTSTGAPTSTSTVTAPAPAPTSPAAPPAPPIPTATPSNTATAPPPTSTAPVIPASTSIAASVSSPIPVATSMGPPAAIGTAPMAPATATVAPAKPSQVAAAPTSGVAHSYPALATSTATPAPRTTRTTRGPPRRASGPVGPAMTATVRASGSLTLNSMVTVSGQTRPGLLVSVGVDLTTTTTVSHTVVVYVPATRTARTKDRGARPRAGASSAKTVACRARSKGCVARSVTRLVTRATLLYRTATRVRADRKGHFAARVRLGYRARRAVRATLTVTATVPLARGRFARSTPVRVTPPPPPSLPPHPSKSKARRARR